MANRITKAITASLLSRYAHAPNENELPVVLYNDFIGKNIILEGFYEKKLVYTIINSLTFETANYLCLDIGANIGNHTLQFKNSFKEVKSFEPQIKTFKVLSLNTDYLKNVQIYNYGLSNEEAEILFKISRTNVGGASQYFSGNNYYEEFVKFKIYDDYFDEEIAYVKIDVEGNEIDVIDGMKQNILKYKPVISFEYNLDDKQGLLALLKSLGYKTFLVPKEHFINTYIKSNQSPLLYIKLLVMALTPPTKKVLVEIDLSKVDKNYGLVTTYHPDSKFKVKAGF